MTLGIPDVLLDQTRAKAKQKAKDDYGGLVRYVSNPVGWAKLKRFDEFDVQRLKRLQLALSINTVLGITVLVVASRTTWWVALLMIVFVFAYGRINWAITETNTELAARSMAIDILLAISADPGAQEFADIEEECRPSADKLRKVIETEGGALTG